MKRYLLVLVLLLVSVIGFGRVYSSWRDLPERERRMFVEARDFVLWYYDGYSDDLRSLFDLVEIRVGEVCIDSNYSGRSIGCVVGDVFEYPFVSRDDVSICLYVSECSVSLLVHEMSHIVWRYIRFMDRDYYDSVVGLCSGLRSGLRYSYDSYLDGVDEFLARLLVWRRNRYISGMDVVCRITDVSNIERSVYRDIFGRYSDKFLNSVLSKRI